VNQTYSRTPDGRTVSEIVAQDLDTTIEDVLHLARADDVEVVWIHGGDFLSAGFTRRQGFVRLACAWAEPTISGEELHVLSDAERVELMNSAFRDVWGHHEYDSALDSSDTRRLTIGMYVDDDAVGICTFWPDQRLVDGPGVREPYRNAERKVGLLESVCNELGAENRFQSRVSGPEDQFPANLSFDLFESKFSIEDERLAVFAPRLNFDRSATPRGPQRDSHCPGSGVEPVETTESQRPPNDEIKGLSTLRRASQIFS